MKKNNWIWFVFSAALILLSVWGLVRHFIAVEKLFLADFCAYSVIARALFEGNNPFPDHYDVLFYQFFWGSTVPIVYPGQMLFFVIPAYLWGSVIQILFFALNIGIVFFLLGLTFVKACGYQPRDLWAPGKKQFVFALCCCVFFLSCGMKDAMKFGQIPIVLALCFYLMFWCADWGRVSFWLRTVLFAFIAVAKYSLLPVVAPILFFKGHWKLCIAAFSLFVFFSISPVFCGNNLVEVYTEYLKAVSQTVQPGGINHYGSYPSGMCHLDCFKNPVIVYFFKALIICVVLWLFRREYKTKSVSDTLLLLSFSLTMLLCYHRIYDIVFVYPLFAIRLFDFARTRQWLLFGITVLFPLFLILPRKVSYEMIASPIGGISGMNSLVYLTDSEQYPHLFPIMVLFTIALTLWSLYLYLHVKDPYRFEIPIPGKKISVDPEGAAGKEQ